MTPEENEGVRSTLKCCRPAYMSYSYAGPSTMDPMPGTTQHDRREYKVLAATIPGAEADLPASVIIDDSKAPACLLTTQQGNNLPYSDTV